ncbi:uncharacterized protein [Rutidosis leptorrhynchoides]|uniref:uncharacterized protein n=1 Tax=Rutidosis leptorrhynchoides TaxID=125765 RepID=UPI003A99103B
MVFCDGFGTDFAVETESVTVLLVIGDGRHVYAWHDIWSDNGPLDYFISYRHNHRAGFSRNAKVRDICPDGCWIWPTEWESKYPQLQGMAVPAFADGHDDTQWRNFDGDLQQFSVGVAWNSIRERQAVVPWYNVVWFANCVPRYSFMTWLLMGENLKTQDK